MNIINYIYLQDSNGFGLSNEFLERKLVKISKKVVEVSYISQVPTKAELYKNQIFHAIPFTEPYYKRTMYVPVPIHGMFLFRI